MRCTVLLISTSTLCAALLKAGLDVAIASPQLQTPVWPDKDYPPLVSANRLFEAVHQACPQQGWNEHLLSHTEEGPWDRVADSLTPAENAAIEKAQEQCDAGLSCPADTRFGMEVEIGYLHELVQAICSKRASPDW